MRTVTGRRLPLFLAAALAAASCARAPRALPPSPDDGSPAAFVDSTAEYSPLRFGNGQVTLNDRCPVRKVKLNRRLEPMLVNGQAIGFC